MAVVKMARLNKHRIDATKPVGGRDIVIWDDTLHGFGLRVKSSGTKGFILQYRNSEGRSRRYTIGNTVESPLMRRGSERENSSV